MPTFFVGNPEIPLEEEKAPTLAVDPWKKVAPPKPVTGVETGGFLSRFGDETLSSRLRRSLPSQRAGASASLKLELKIRWEALVKLQSGARGVLQANDRIVVLGQEDRETFDASGASLGFRSPLEGDVLLDSDHGLLWYGDQVGAIAARRLKDGGQELLLLGALGPNTSRGAFVRRGDRLLLVSREMPNKVMRTPPNLTAIELWDLGSPPKVGPSGFLEGAKRAGLLYCKTRPIFTAVSGERFVAVVSNRIYFFGLGALGLERVLMSRFMPLALSLDEAARIHLIVSAPDETLPPEHPDAPAKTYLWVLEPTGERAFSFELPPGVQRPPIVGYDHSVYVLSGNTVFALSAEGKLLWQRAFPRLGGAAATSCGRLLVSSGTDLTAFDAQGEPTVLATLPGEIQGAAVLTAGGEVVAATQNHLYLLAPA
jgi:hypothetical protein